VFIEDVLFFLLFILYLFRYLTNYKVLQQVVVKGNKNSPSHAHQKPHSSSEPTWADWILPHTLWTHTFDLDPRIHV
jgi:hypothetical protein